MPYDEQGFQYRAERMSLRAAVLDLIGQSSDQGSRDETEFRAALGDLVARSRDRADDLWMKYRGEHLDSRALAYAKYGY